MVSKLALNQPFRHNSCLDAQRLLIVGGLRVIRNLAYCGRVAKFSVQLADSETSGQCPQSNAVPPMSGNGCAPRRDPRTQIS
jgi:hypothetical protein